MGTTRRGILILQQDKIAGTCGAITKDCKQSLDIYEPNLTASLTAYLETADRYKSLYKKILHLYASKYTTAIYSQNVCCYREVEVHYKHYCPSGDLPTVYTWQTALGFKNSHLQFNKSNQRKR